MFDSRGGHCIESQLPVLQREKGPLPQDCRHEDREELVLRALDAILGLEEREPDEKTTNNVQDELRHEVRGISPVRFRITLEEFDHLVCPRSGEFSMDGCGNRWSVTTFSVDSFNFPLGVL